MYFNYEGKLEVREVREIKKDWKFYLNIGSTIAYDSGILVNIQQINWYITLYMTKGENVEINQNTEYVTYGHNTVCYGIQFFNFFNFPKLRYILTFTFKQKTSVSIRVHLY